MVTLAAVGSDCKLLFRKPIAIQLLRKKENPISTLVQIEDFLSLREHMPLVDVRAPVEYAQARIAEAINIPLFDDEERAAIGTAYKKNGRRAAVLRGLDYVGPKMRRLADRSLKLVRDFGKGKATTSPELKPAIKTGNVPQTEFPNSQILIHCARGGMRSESFCWLAEQVELEALRLDGGYKSYRRFARDYFSKSWDLVVLTGLTGAGKTRQLHHLRELGEQVLDLEGLANHRGSAFGGIGQGGQPKTEQFENLIFESLYRMDPSRRIWIEDESRAVGQCMVPNAFFDQLHSAPAIFMDVDVSIRAENLVVDYGNLPQDEMNAAIDRISKRLGGQNVNSAKETLAGKELEMCARVLLEYYDKTYMVCQDKNPRTTTLKTDMGEMNLEERSKAILKAAEAL